MDKQQVITFIREQLDTGRISKDDIFRLTEFSATSHGADKVLPSPGEINKGENQRKFAYIFYIIGAIIAVAGVVILIAQNWQEAGFFGRIATTVGISLIAYITALLLKKIEHRVLSQVIFVISAVLAPLGAYVMTERAGLDFTWLPQFVTALVLTSIFGIALLVSKRTILIIVTIGFASWAYYALIIKFIGYGYSGDNLFEWATILLGVSYLLVAHGVATLDSGATPEYSKEIKAVQNILYTLGTLAILGSSTFVGGVFDIFLIALIFSVFYGSVYLRSRSMLVLGGLFLILHTVKLTIKYFVNSVGWSLGLICVGFIVIGAGYLTFYINRKFMQQKVSF